MSLRIFIVYSEFWRIKFNAKKSNIVEFGPQFFKNSNFLLNNNIIPIVENIIYLGVKIDNKLNFNNIAIEKVSNVQKSFFSRP